MSNIQIIEKGTHLNFAMGTSLNRYATDSDISMAKKPVANLCKLVHTAKFKCAPFLII